jgi:hypothetical protein
MLPHGTGLARAPFTLRAYRYGDEYDKDWRLLKLSLYTSSGPVEEHVARASEKIQRFPAALIQRQSSVYASVRDAMACVRIYPDHNTGT